MCGIYGMVSLRGEPLRHCDALGRMAQSLRHRGPDGHASFSDPLIALGVDRLRIIDLHERADQPFADPEDQVWVAANGEIYNAPELRSRYRHFPYRSGSDIETILPLYLERGTQAIRELDGMFALALWDHRRRRLLLARDRAGEKPLFYAEVAGEVWFASEIQALLQHPDLSHTLDPIAVSQFLTLGYVLEPRTLFSAIRRVEAGTYLRVEAGGSERCRYWDPDALATLPPPEDTSASHLDALLRAAVAKQLMSDVPLGVFVSGGVDSSLLAALATDHLGAENVETFAIRFAAASYDESSGAREVATRLGTRHFEVEANDDTLRHALVQVTTRLAEPVADPAILPTYLLACEARRRVTVVLSGEGADELFGGYPTYLGHKAAPLFLRLPTTVRRAVHGIVDRWPSSDRRVTLEFLLKRFLAAAEQPWAERHLAWFGPGLLGPSKEIREAWLRPLLDRLATEPPLAGAMLLDYKSYLRDNLLVKVDRATMLTSLEARAPYLDRDLSAFALRLPEDLRVHRWTTKWLLKEVARRYLGDQIAGKRKRGLSVPIAAWLNGGLRDEVDRLLAHDRLREQGLLDAGLITRLLSEHRDGRANHARPLWTAFVLQGWLDRWSPGAAAAGRLDTAP